MDSPQQSKTAILDRYGAIRDETWMRATYGAEIDRAEGDAKFRLAEVREREGPVTISVRVLNEAGAPEFGRTIAFWWPGMEPEDRQSLESLETWQWHDHAKLQETDEYGVTNFTFGQGGMIRDLGEGGPYDIWVVSPSTPSDAMALVGWLGGTEHRGMHVMTFQLDETSEEEEEQIVLEGCAKWWMEWQLKLIFWIYDKFKGKSDG